MAGYWGSQTLFEPFEKTKFEPAKNFVNRVTGVSGNYDLICLWLKGRN